MMTKFVGVFRELASFNELLNTQVELILVERLHRNWLKVCNTHAPALAPEVKSMLLRKQETNQHWGRMCVPAKRRLVVHFQASS